MTLIKSISGFRGTIGAVPGEHLTPLDTVKFTAAFAAFLQHRNNKQSISIVVGRDARISGEMLQNLVMNTLVGMGVHVIDAGLSTTPTVEWAVTESKANGGIILTASHNPKEWNALKLLNEKGEFISGDEGKEVLRRADADDYAFCTVDELGSIEERNFMKAHIQHILGINTVDAALVASKKFKIAVDGINSTGGIYVPALLDALGVENIVPIHCKADGHFAHNPEPLAEHLTDIVSIVKKEKCDLGIVVDPDVDRLAFVCEDGSLFGEEYTLVAIADYLLGITPGPTVSNLSSSRALADVTHKHGQRYEASAVGEVNVVAKMKEIGAVIGGEGNGGIIYPELHYGRDSLVGIALFLSHLAHKDTSMTALRASYPNYVISKNKIDLAPTTNVDDILVQMAKKYAANEVDTTDGVKIYIEKEWVHLRKSNTEPIIRIYAESASEEKATSLALRIIEEIKAF